MLVIESVANPKYICGVFEREKDAKAYLKGLPADLRRHLRVYNVELQFPCFIIEEDGFEFTGQEDLIARLDQLNASHFDDQVYFNIYLIDSDFRPKKAGLDSMGMLRHVHVTSDFLNWYKSEGIGYLNRIGMLD